MTLHWERTNKGDREVLHFLYAASSFSPMVPWKDWNFSQLNDELCSLFPRLFEYLNDQPRVINYSYNSSKQDPSFQYLPPYHLCVKSCTEVAIASGVNFPDGETVFMKIKAGKQPSHDDSEIYFVTHDKIPYYVLEQWKHPTTMMKAAGKRKAACISDSNSDADFTSRLAESDEEFGAPLASPLPRCSSKHLRVATSDGTDNLLLFPASTSSPKIIDLNEDINMETSAGILGPALPPDSVMPAATAPFTPVAMSSVHPPNSSSFVIDESITNPWEVNHTFHF
ncbi:hypothetical protein SCLCIDRAFT_12330 [Scleroderma citrinum Foug A]|uniref:Uncharacterized protein n=1 Tax=Scleroderma citrinum Foug A TaxID=1036808 RepID=A0A0C3D305_9AGAM|nr:hypothetical protein SCLCIDRAFT_12330 [Scleroderma citrinum Foug A]